MHILCRYPHNKYILLLIFLFRLLLLLLLGHLFHENATKRKQCRIDRAPSEQDPKVKTYPRM